MNLKIHYVFFVGAAIWLLARRCQARSRVEHTFYPVSDWSLLLFTKRRRLLLTIFMKHYRLRSRSCIDRHCVRGMKQFRLKLSSVYAAPGGCGRSQVVRAQRTTSANHIDQPSCGCML